MTERAHESHSHGHCDEILIVLQTWVDEQLDESTSGKVTSHLERCPVCDSEAKSYMRLKAALRRQRIACDEIVVERLQVFGQRLCRGDVQEGADPGNEIGQ